MERFIKRWYMFLSESLDRACTTSLESESLNWGSEAGKTARKSQKEN